LSQALELVLKFRDTRPDKTAHQQGAPLVPHIQFIHKVIRTSYAVQFARVARVCAPFSFTPQTLGEFRTHMLASCASSGALIASLREPVASHARFA
jgi:hypothetical protein